ncbi:MAG: precorrin-2 C(20)-methyltransferase [Candidatus Omnitrophica bacterium]|nr:precorrin-2 C(20)-methyltransferase [Candidatus Omnitrophota bacterium]
MASINKQIVKGDFYGIGVGPGDPELLTVKARRVLSQVDIVFAPKAAIAANSFAYEIVKECVSESKIETITFPMTKNKTELKSFWKDAAEQVYQKICEGKNVAFITIGDPFIYSTYNYLLRHLIILDNTINVYTIPGISVVNAIASLFNVPLAEGEDKFIVTPLPSHLAELKKLIEQFETVVLLKIGKNLKPLLEFLKKNDYEKNAYFARHIGCSSQIVIENISELIDSKNEAGYMSTMIIRRNERGGSLS